MKSLIQFVLTISIAVPSMAFAKTKYNYGKLIAASTVQALGNLKTVGSFKAWVGQNLNKEESGRLGQFFRTHKLSLETEFPKLTQKGNRVYFSKDQFISFSKDKLMVNGKTFKMKPMSVVDAMERVCKALRCKMNKVSFVDFFIPKAHAFLSGNGRNVLLSAVAGAALGYFMGPQWGITNKYIGAAGGGGIGALLGGLFLRDGVSAFMTTNSQTQCTQNGYRITNPQSSGRVYNGATTNQAFVPHGLAGGLMNLGGNSNCQSYPVTNFVNSFTGQYQPSTGNFRQPVVPPSGAVRRSQ